MKIPSLKLHKGTGQSYVWWKGKAVYFGKHGESATDKAYWRWRESLGVEAAGGRTVGELLTLYEESRVINRRDKSRLNNLKDALTGIGGLEVNAYGPAIFRQHRDQVASTGTRSARQVNDLMQFMRRIVKWGAEKGFCKPEVWTNLGIVKRLDRSDIPIEPKTIKPANHDDVIATMQHLKDTPWAIIRLLMLTGARPSEIVSLRKSEIFKNGSHGTWYAKPSSHKNAKRGKHRFIVFNQEAQEILELVTPRSEGDYVFPSGVLLNDHYQEASLRQAVGHACTAAGVTKWTPYQLRHMRITEVAVEHGLEVAAAIAGHSSIRTTQIYQHMPDAESVRKVI